MKTVYYEKYGSPDVLQLREIPEPEPGEKEMLVKVAATTVTAGALLARKGAHPDSRFFTVMLRLFFGLFRPRKNITGYEFSGIVEKIGSRVSAFRPGDAVFGTNTGLPSGAYAEYICVPEKWKQGVVAGKPEYLSFSEAAALPVGAMAALQILRKAGIQKGQKVLIYGASGSVGTYALQIAGSLGARVWGVCSTENIELVKSLGAHGVIDYKKENFTETCRDFDVVFDAVAKISRSSCKAVLKERGTFISIKSPTSETDEKLNTILELCRRGELKPFIDREYPLEQTAEAHRYADTGHKRGNVVITVSSLPADRT
ncbi:MAG: NAD(P)-dependent alcohol dehydrogenase [Spirochaetales bacterium]|nr:NAD(P)-dependent alcohol dehydrogenase [Spirochaetales bacterium]